MQAVEAEAADNETADGDSLAGGSDGGDVSGSESAIGSSYSGGLSGGSAFFGGGAAPELLRQTLLSHCRSTGSGSRATVDVSATSTTLPRASPPATAGHASDGAPLHVSALHRGTLSRV